MEHKPDETLYIACRLLRSTTMVDDLDFTEEGQKLIGVTESMKVFSIKKEGDYYWLSLRNPGVPRQTVVSKNLDKIIEHLD
jgi:hypothetical protein